MIRLVLSRAVAERIVRALHELAARTLDVEEELHARVLAKLLGSALRAEPKPVPRTIVEELGARLWLYLTEYQGLVLVHIVRMRVDPRSRAGDESARKQQSPMTEGHRGRADRDQGVFSWDVRSEDDSQPAGSGVRRR